MMSALLVSAICCFLAMCIDIYVTLQKKFDVCGMDQKEFGSCEFFVSCKICRMCGSHIKTGIGSYCQKEAAYRYDCNQEDQND